MKRPWQLARALAVLGASALAIAACTRQPSQAPAEPAPAAAPDRTAETSPPAPVAPPAAPEPAIPPPLAPSAEEFLLRETAWAQALADKNGAALERLLAPEFLITGVGSTAEDPVGGRGEWLESVAKYPWPMHAVADVRLAALGDTVVVKCVWSGIYPPNSLTPQGGALRLLITDVWVRRGGEWVVLARHTSLPRQES